MRFLTPYWLWLLPALALGGLWLWRRFRREFHRRLDRFVAARLTHPLKAQGVLRLRTIKLLLVIAAGLALVAALSRPLGGLKAQAANRQGVNLLIALDGSSSMLAEDVAPNRFGTAQAGIDSLLHHLGGGRAGLLLFGGQATFVSPLTFDTISLQLMNRGLSPEWVGKGGTSLSEVIKRAAEFFHNKPYAARILMIFTDGEETEGDAMVAAQEAFRKEGLRIFTIGVGTPGGAVIPRLERNLQRELVRTGTIHDNQGQEVRTRLDEPLLRRVALMAGGSYVNLSSAGGDLAKLAERSIQPLAAPMEETPLTDYTEWFQLPLALALGLLIAAALLPAGKAVSAPEDPGRTKNGQRLTHQGTTVATAVLLCLIAGAAKVRAASIEEQHLLKSGKTAQAFALLQGDLLKTPDDPMARYNYAIGAYAAGKYATAIETFEKLSASADPLIEPLSHVQLGNSLYRSGEELRPGNSAGAIIQWEKACAAYQKAPGNPVADHNVKKTRRDLFGLLREVADAKIAEGDAAARQSPDQGIPAWREAATHLDHAAKLSDNDAEAGALAALRASVSDKIYRAFFDRAEDKARHAELQQDTALERAIDQMSGAVDDYTEALAIRPTDNVALAGKAHAASLLDPWRIKLADRQHAEGVAAKGISLEDAISHWQLAAGNYTRVLEHAPSNPAAVAGQQENNHSLHDGYVELGDRKQVRANETTLAPAERDALLEEALDHYRTALQLEPADAETPGKIQQVGLRLVTTFVARGQQELAKGKSLARSKPPEAIASLERAVQSFGQALQFDPTHAAAKLGQNEAQELLKRLRDLDAREQRKVLAHNKDIGDTKQLEDPGKLALKLLDYDNDKLASKKQQNYTAPENRPAKDW